MHLHEGKKKIKKQGNPQTHWKSKQSVGKNKHQYKQHKVELLIEKMMLQMNFNSFHHCNQQLDENIIPNSVNNTRLFSGSDSLRDKG